jgi:hypothetical protein
LTKGARKIRRPKPSAGVKERLTTSNLELRT